MPRFRTLATALLLAAFTTAAQAAEAPAALFGVELGARAAFPACTTGEEASTARHCLAQGPVAKTAWGGEQLRVFYPRSGHAPYARGELLVDTLGGVVVAIHIDTWGIQSQAPALEMLNRRYGAPTRSRSEKIPRARIPAQFAEWELGERYVRFDGVTSTIDWGRITLTTQRQRRLMDGGAR